MGMKTAIDMVAKEYNLDLNANISGFYPCKSDSCYPIKEVTTKVLLGHKDVGNTDCPGPFIYNSLPTWRQEIMGNNFANIPVVASAANT